MTRQTDENYVCAGCGGHIKPQPGELFKGLQVYRCASCGRGRQLECPHCGYPRTIWSAWTEEEKVCAFCGGGYERLTKIFKFGVLCNAGCN